MGRIILETKINNSQQICFDLSTSIDLHKLSTKHTQEEAIEGIQNGLIKLNEHVTWRAKHLGLWFKLTTKITEFNPPNYFVDEMISGPFKSMRHEHIFKDIDGQTLMTDKFVFKSPLGLLGRLVDKLLLDRYLKTLLIKRNQIIKEFAESEKWRELAK
jgi:ligand-binding SRPBCC domain-containing protein